MLFNVRDIGEMVSRKISIAPMMGYTNRYFRALLRVICPPAYLYSEMITAAALVRRDQEYVARLLDFSACEQPVALQLGGANPQELALAAKMGQDWGYSEINLNVGCPSDRVQAGNFGACLMKDPDLVAACVEAMSRVVSIPVTVKTRIGVDNLDSYENLCNFITKVSAVGCEVFIVHARKAWLHGLNPRQNRTVPPLHYDVVYQLKRDFPALEIIINGGIADTDSVQGHLQHVDGVMIGRAAYQDPLWLAQLGSLYRQCDESVVPGTVGDIISGYLPVVREALMQGKTLAGLAGGLVGVCKGVPGARNLRRVLFDPNTSPEEGVALLSRAAKDLAAKAVL